MNATSAHRPATVEPVLVSLMKPGSYPHPVGPIRLIETHISWVFLTGTYAYKIKKPVDLGFLDFTTLAARHFYCEEEVRLNRRLAPDIYLDVVAIRAGAQGPQVGGAGAALEYAVRMRQFPQHALASYRLSHGRLSAFHIDKLADCLVAFHATAFPTIDAAGFGSPDSIRAAALQTFDQIYLLLNTNADKCILSTLREWTQRESSARREVFDARKRSGRIRECHGDLHLGNIAIIDDRPVPFDCLEFNPELRWVDVMSEIAFVVMDLDDRKRADLATRFLNRYLEATGDHDGLPVLRFYLVYRALVRAKVHLMRAQQPGVGRASKTRLVQAFRKYLKLAQRYVARTNPSLIITHGLSGCGKTAMTEPLAEHLGAIRIRSDVERKRLYGYAPISTSRSSLAAGVYSPHANAATYRKLAELAALIVNAGYPVIVDATFIKRAEREAFRSIAEKSDVPFIILNVLTPLPILRKRIVQRRLLANDSSEADLTVLDHQIATREPLTPAEMTVAICVDGTRHHSSRTWRALIGRARSDSAGPR